MNDLQDLKAYIDGQLEPEESDRFAAELATNEDLARESEFLRLIGDGVRACEIDIPVRGADEALDRVRRPLRTPLWQWALVGCGVVVVSAVLFPTYAQSKYSARRTAAYAQLRHSWPTGREMLGADASDPTLSRVSSGESGVALNPASVSGGSTTWSSIVPSSSANPSAKFQAIDRQPRMVVQNGDLDEIVSDVSAAESQAMGYAKSIGGFVGSSSMNQGPGVTPESQLTVRVPAGSFSAAMNYFKRLAIDSTHIKSMNVTGEDVTAQYADVTARLKVMEAEEDSYVTMLRAARKIGEILEIKDRLSTVRQDIESSKSQAAALANQSDLSTINITLEQQPKIDEPAPSTSWSQDTWTNAVSGLHGSLQFLGTLAIYAFVYAPIWLAIGIVGWIVHRRARMR